MGVATLLQGGCDSRRSKLPPLQKEGLKSVIYCNWSLVRRLRVISCQSSKEMTLKPFPIGHVCTTKRDGVGAVGGLCPYFGQCDHWIISSELRLGRVRCAHYMGYLAQKKQHPRRTLQQEYASGPIMVLGGWLFLMSEVPLYRQRITCMSSKIPFPFVKWCGFTSKAFRFSRSSV